MPQPIKRRCDILFGGLDSLPEHAAQLGMIVALSGQLESQLGHALAYLSQASARVVIPMFHAVSSTEAQRAMLVAAAEAQLSGAELDEFRDLMEEFRTRYNERNRLVHNVWATSPQHPGKAIWIHARDMTLLAGNVASLENQEQLKLLLDTDPGLWKKASTYTVDDLRSVWTRLNAYLQRFMTFTSSLFFKHPILGVQEANDAPDNQLPQG